MPAVNIQSELNLHTTTQASEPFTLHAPGFSLADTLDCGQSFRWEQRDGVYTGVSAGKMLTVKQDGDTLHLYGIRGEDLPYWSTYFDLDGSYSALKAAYQPDPILRQACAFAGGITLLRQDPWEALCSFIFSQNNNIPRIKGIVRRFCEEFGEPLAESIYAFPTAETVSGLSIEDLAEIRAGFRAKYILDAARKVSAGALDLEYLRDCPLGEARELLQTIMGVGPKVAECALLYGLHRLDAFPIDVWVKRVLERFYPDGFPGYPCPGVAQQYLFHSIRMGALHEPEQAAGL